MPQCASGLKAPDVWQPLRAATRLAKGKLKLKTPWRDGATLLVRSPLEFMQRLAALVLHLIRFHGVLAPNAKLSALVVPQGPEVAEQVTEAAVASECEAETIQGRPHRVSCARLFKRVFAAAGGEDPDSPGPVEWLARKPSASSAVRRLALRDGLVDSAMCRVNLQDLSARRPLPRELLCEDEPALRNRHGAKRGEVDRDRRDSINPGQRGTPLDGPGHAGTIAPVKSTGLHKYRAISRPGTAASC